MDHISKTVRKAVQRQRSPQGERRFEQNWKDAHPYLKSIDWLTFRRMRISCSYCQARDQYCDFCGGAGLQCPTCKGLGKLARHRKSAASALEVCPDCMLEMSEGPTFDSVKCMLAIERYILAWQEGRAIDDELTRQKEAEKERIEWEAQRPQPRLYWQHERTQKPAGAGATNNKPDEEGEEGEEGEEEIDF